MSTQSSKTDPLIGRKEQVYLIALQSRAHAAIEVQEFKTHDPGGPNEGARLAAWFSQLAVIEGSESARRTAWRKADMTAQLGVDSLTKCRRSQVRLYKAHLLTLAGEEGALNAAIKTGQPANSAHTDDTVESRERWIYKINKALKGHERRVNYPATKSEHARAKHAQSGGGVLPMAYVFGIIRRNEGKGTGFNDLSKLTTHQLQKTYYTLERAISYREGRPSKAAKKP